MINICLFFGKIRVKFLPKKQFSTKLFTTCLVPLMPGLKCHSFSRLEFTPLTNQPSNHLAAATKLQTELAPFIQAINLALDEFTQFGDECPKILSDAIRYSLLASGKRIRPLLTLLACRSCGGDFAEAIPVGCAVEMIHCYSLIHDDLPAMDDDDFRRGRPSCHKQFDEATAILAGDALQPLAYQIISNNVAELNIANACVSALAKAAGPENLVGGQVDDLAAQSSSNGHWTVEKLEKIHRRKTGALLTVSLQLGGIVANANDQQFDALTQYGRRLGLAFQIADDLLDLCGDPEKIGKSTGKDVRQQKLTYPGLLGENESSAKANELIGEAIECLDVFDSDADQLRSIARFVIDRQH